MDDIVKPLAGAAFCIAALMPFVSVGIYVLPPIVIIGGGYALYAYHRDHPKTVGNRLRQQALSLHENLAGRFPTPQKFAEALELPFPELTNIAEQLYANEVINVPPIPL